ncbi:hypothetical protein BGZ47_007260 [Haplosporangium gracile]|nr:hypothetical protein BGZ47_007260 [Haplosporangium gracile]
MESFTILEDSDLIDDMPRFVSMVLERHAKILKTVRWLEPVGIGPDKRLDLEWFMYAYLNLEQVEITHDNRFCSSGQCAVGTVIIPEHNPTTLFLPPSSSSIPTPAKTPPIHSKIGLSSWACTSTLTYLDISFNPFTTIKDDHQCRIQIESLYKKLDQLTALVELHIGCERRCQGPQLQTCQHTICPEARATAAKPAATFLTTTSKNDHQQIPPLTTTTMTATPIFDMSLTIGDLEILNISRIQGHNIQIPELEWMKTQWSRRLRSLQGIKRYWPDDRLKVNWPDLEARWCNCDYAHWKDDWKKHRPVVKY